MEESWRSSFFVVVGFFCLIVLFCFFLRCSCEFTTFKHPIYEYLECVLSESCIPLMCNRLLLEWNISVQNLCDPPASHLWDNGLILNEWVEELKALSASELIQ